MSAANPNPPTFQELILRLQTFWAERGCVVLQPYDMEVGAGTSHTATFLRALGPEPWRAAYVQPSRRPKDGRYGENPNRLRYAAPTGTVLIRWDGARQPTIWTVPEPEVDPRDARLELARRYLHIFGPTTAESFAEWAGISAQRGVAAFDGLRRWLTPVRTPVGDSWILTSDEPTVRAASRPAASARLLPSGDAYFLLQGRDRELLVPDALRRRALWTSRVWPGGLLVGGDIAGTWRRAGGTVTIQAWRRLTRAERDGVAAEAASLPLPDLQGRVVVRWDD